MTSIGSSNFINQVNLSTNTSTNIQTTTSNTGNTSMGNDALSLSSTTANTGTLPMQAGGWKRFSNSVGEFFSNVADKMGFGETAKLIKNEFNQVDTSRNGSLNVGEFNVATLNLFDFFGSEFARADKNRNGAVEMKEYVDYRKEQLDIAFQRKEKTNDKHLNINEIGFIGQQFLVNRDPRLDENQDGLVNKREFTRSVVRGTMNIREFLGF